MLTKAHLAALLVAVSAGTVACAADSTSTPAPTPSSSSTKTTDAALHMTQSAGKVSGTYAHLADTLSFELSTLPNGTYAVTVNTRGLTLDATIDAKNGASSFDGFATENGGETQLTKQDLPILVAFNKALDASIDTKDTLQDTLLRATTVWSEWSPTMKLQRRVLGEENRSWVSYCGYIGQVVTAQHDCCTHWYDPCSSHNGYGGDGRAEVHAYVGDYGTPTTWVWNNGWSSQGVDHWNWPYEYGDCYGRCGADCGGGHTYTQDCHNHDSCVRNGHWIGSPYCDDEFVSTLDDAISAPNCY